MPKEYGRFYIKNNFQRVKILQSCLSYLKLQKAVKSVRKLLKNVYTFINVISNERFKSGQMPAFLRMYFDLFLRLT